MVKNYSYIIFKRPTYTYIYIHPTKLLRINYNPRHTTRKQTPTSLHLQHFHVDTLSTGSL